jgi:hypothetical protein
MALYGQARDISMFRYVNRELMGNIISQQAAFYKLRLLKQILTCMEKLLKQKYYDGPILLYTLIDLPDQEWSTDDLGVNFNWKPTFRFLRDDLLDKLKDFNEDTIYGANLVPQPGDIILYETAYYEVTATNAAQYFVGKDPDYPNSPQPSNPAGATYPLPSPLWNPGLDEFGYNVSIICQTTYVPADKVGITLERM